MSEERIRNITTNASGKDQYELVKKRTEWVRYLEKNSIRVRKQDADEVSSVLCWADGYRSTEDELGKLIKGHEK